MSITRNQWAVEMGRRGGLKGGPARARKLSPERRSEISRNAAEKRWTVEKESRRARIAALRRELVILKRPPTIFELQHVRRICLETKESHQPISAPRLLQAIADICTWAEIHELNRGAVNP